MNRWTLLLTTILIGLFLLFGCSGGNNNPVTTDTGPDLTSDVPANTAQSDTWLWGYWDIYMDLETMEVEAIPNRQAMFTANITKPLNNSLAGLVFSFNGVNPGTGYTDVNMDITINHPFPGAPALNGYDVRAIFMGNGSATMAYDPDLKYSVPGTDQMLVADSGIGGPDGYTRWYNRIEFLGPGPELFTYTPGKFASPGFNGTATLNPYKYYADGLGATDDVYDWLAANFASNGVFSSGASNTRNWNIRFPNSTGIKYGYCVIASWESATTHPANGNDAMAVQVADSSTVYYESLTSYGGDLDLSIKVFDWVEHSFTGEMTDYQLFIQSTTLYTPYQLNTTEMTPIDMGNHWYQYDVKVPVDVVSGMDGEEYWVIVKTADYDYTNPFGVPNTASDNLTAFFRYDLTVLPEMPCLVPSVLGTDPIAGLVDTVIDDMSVEVTDLVDGPSLDVTLRKSGQPPIAGTDITYISDVEVTADFDLTGAELGQWDVLVTNGCGEEPGIGLGIFEVTDCATPDVLAIDPNSALPDEILDDVLITVDLIEDGPSLLGFLELPGDPPIVGTDVQFIDATSFTCDFDLTGAPEGTYDVKVLNGCGGAEGVGEGLFAITACPLPEVTDMNPDTGQPGAILDDVTITGNNIVDGACLDATLYKDGEDPIFATDVTYVDVNTFTCDFDLTGAALGLWELEVVNGCCSEPEMHPDFFEVLELSDGLYIIDSGDVPDVLPFPDEINFCVVGNNISDHEGVYYFGDNYDIMFYPLDYSADGQVYMTMEGNYDIDPIDFFGEPSELGALEVDPSGGVIITSRGEGIIWATNEQNSCTMWFEPENPVVANALTVNSDSFGKVRSRDCEASFGFYEILWANYGTETIIDPSVTITMNGVSYSYEAGDYADGWGVGYGPVDTSGSSDGEISDMEVTRIGIDSDPQGISDTLDVMIYFLETAPDDPGIEVFAYALATGGETYQFITTIDEVFTGTPVDLSCLNSYENIPDATVGNWVCVLEDNGDSTWQIALFNQEGTLIQRFDTAQNGDPVGIDCDNENMEMHVWADNGGTLEYTIFGYN